MMNKRITYYNYITKSSIYQIEIVGLYLPNEIVHSEVK
jgi:hypothetical protein